MVDVDGIRVLCLVVYATYYVYSTYDVYLLGFVVLDSLVQSTYSLSF